MAADGSVTITPPGGGSGTAEAPQQLSGRTVGQLIWRRFRRNRLARAAGGVIGVLLVVAVLAPFFSTMGTPSSPPRTCSRPRSAFISATRTAAA